MGPGIEKFALGRAGGARVTLHIGLVNNMPDAALRATELQFARLLKEASAALDASSLEVSLHLFSLPQIARSEAALSRMEGFYADAAGLATAGLDAVIVTGAEPRAGDLRREPYWDALAALVNWAETGAISTLFSCLAAHAAVLHLDNIVRRPLPGKLSGVFPVEPLGEDALLAGMPSSARVPHSRRNDLAEAELVARDYRILSRIGGGGVDLFVRRGRSLLVFLQGHPEYDAGTLGREYLRDVGRFLRGEGERPAVPENYFDRVTEDRLAALDFHDVGEDNLSRYSDVVMGAVPLLSWRGHTVRLFANWLAAVGAEKRRRAAALRPRAHGEDRRVATGRRRA